MDWLYPLVFGEHDFCHFLRSKSKLMLPLEIIPRSLCVPSEDQLLAYYNIIIVHFYLTWHILYCSPLRPAYRNRLLETSIGDFHLTQAWATVGFVSMNSPFSLRSHPAVLFHVSFGVMSRGMVGIIWQTWPCHYRWRIPVVSCSDISPFLPRRL